MTAVFAVAVIAQGALIAFLVWDRRRPTPDVETLIGLCDRLCQRVQAPHAAILEHDEQARATRSEEYAPPAVAPDDDEAYWASRDKLAELLMEQETNGRG